MPRPILLAATLAVACPASAGVLEATAQGFTIENTVTVAAPPPAAWRAMVEDIDRWWPKDHSWWGRDSTLSIDARAGGCFCERSNDGARQAQHLQVVFVDPHATLRMVGGLGPLQGMGLHGVFEATFAPADGGTRITWRYRAGGYTPDDVSRLAPVVDRVQGQQLAGLAAHLARP